MKNYTFHWEVRTLVSMLEDGLDKIIIKRYNKDKIAEDQIHANIIYAPKSRLLNDIVNPQQHIELPCISLYITSIRRDANRTFNKLETSYQSLTPTSTGYLVFPQPVAVDIDVGVSIIAKFQQDIDQILTNFIPYCDPYIVVSWKWPLPLVDPPTLYEIRSQIFWNETVNMQYPIDIDKTTPYRIIADTSFTIKGWMFKKDADYDYAKIYKIETTFTSLSQIYKTYKTLVDAREEGYNTESFWISARPYITKITPYLTIKNRSDILCNVYGTMFDYTMGVYVSGTPIAYGQTFLNPFSGTKLSGMYPGFSGVKIEEWTKYTNNNMSFTLPSALSAGYIDVIIMNEAGYGSLIADTKAMSPSAIYRFPYENGIQVFDIG